ncbi:hypothetical protein [Deinococcus hopiensis]|uniref:hypothetical protein n=1 Tax=Deinococcus hopiensis TaxID=309885 RepID=UPI001482BFCA|nr:hypothetical protein [Deinococcus hopiensis]
MHRNGGFVAGGPQAVREPLDQVLRVTGAEDLRVGSQMHLLEDCQRSYERLAETYPQGA